MPISSFQYRATGKYHTHRNICKNLWNKAVEIKPNIFSAIIDLRFVWGFLPLGRYKFLNVPPGSKSLTFEILCPSCVPQIRMGLLRAWCLLCSPCDALFTHCTSRYVQQPFPGRTTCLRVHRFLTPESANIGRPMCPPPPRSTTLCVLGSKWNHPRLGDLERAGLGQRWERHWGHERIIRKNLSAPSSPAAN